MSWYVMDLPPVTPWLDPAVDRFGQGMGCAAKTPKWAVPDEKVRVWKSSSTQIYPNLRYDWGKTLPPFLTKQTGSGSMRMRFSTSSIVCFSPYPAELTFPSNLNYIDIDNESLVTWLHHVTSHFFLYLPPQWNYTMLHPIFFYFPPLCSQWNPLSRKCPSLLRWLSVANPWPCRGGVGPIRSRCSRCSFYGLSGLGPQDSVSSSSCQPRILLNHGWH